MTTQMVAEVGLEPHDLRVMSPTSYQLLHSAVLCYDYVAIAVKTGAGDRGRTGTILAYHWILSPRRLPVPPHRQKKTFFFVAPEHYITYQVESQAFFSIFRFFAASPEKIRGVQPRQRHPLPLFIDKPA